MAAEVNGEKTDRASNGQFVKGNRASVGNSGGSARKTARDVLNGRGPKALMLLADLAEGKQDKLPDGQTLTLALRIECAIKVAEWCFGKPETKLSSDGASEVDVIIIRRRETSTDASGDA
jgi:hypothetical protein